MRSLYKIALYVAFVLSVFPGAAFAHSAGYSLEYRDESFFFDIGYSDPFMEGLPIRFDLELKDVKTEEMIPFTGIWVRISQGPKTVFAGPIGRALFGSPGFSFSFPAEGQYEMSVRFEDGKGSIAQHIFLLAVADDGESEGAPWPMAAGVAFAAGVAVSAAVLTLTRKGR